MSRLDDLLNSLCPDGVKFKALGDICEIRSGWGFPNSEQGKKEGELPFFKVGDMNNAGNEQFMIRSNNYISKETSHRLKCKPAPKGTILFPKIGAAIGTNKKRITVCDSCYDNNIMGLIANDQIVLYRYLFYNIESVDLISFADYSGAMPSIRKSTLEKYCIPVPPLEVQQEIVRILDSFTALTAELWAEFEKRMQQYGALSTLLFDDINKNYSKNVEDICYIEKGKTPIQKAIAGQYPLVVTTSERKTSNCYQFETPSVCIPLVSSRGHGVASLNHVYYQEGKFALGNILCAITPKNQNQVLAKYLYFYFEQTKDYTLVPLMKGGANVALRIDDIHKIKVPIPPIEKQNNIIHILQLFEDYCINSLSSEISARQKQYEYYRDKLLTFKEFHT